MTENLESTAAATMLPSDSLPTGKPASGPAPEPTPEPTTEPTTEDLPCYSRSGRLLPPTHPDHGPMHLLPRQEDGTLSPYYYCSHQEIDRGDLGGPPPRRQRRDGWTAPRMAEFLRTLGATASVTDAARAAGMSRQSAYALYRSRDAEHFRRGWDEAMRGATVVLAATAFDRAVNGTEEAVWYKGEFVGFRRRYDNRLLAHMLRVRDPLNYAPLDDLQGWRRYRDVETAPPLDPALDRLVEAEERWGQTLPETPDAAAAEELPLPGIPEAPPGHCPHDRRSALPSSGDAVGGADADRGAAADIPAPGPAATAERRPPARALPRPPASGKRARRRKAHTGKAAAANAGASASALSTLLRAT